MKPLGLGVLGLGEGRSIISAGVHSDLWNVVCLCDTNDALAQERCAEFGLTDYTTDYDAMLADPAVDVVGIYTPDHLHAEHVIRALDAGKHVICTKPFIDNLARAADVLAAQARSGKQVMVGQSTRFFAPFMRQRQHYESGALGELVTVEASLQRRSPLVSEEALGAPAGLQVALRRHQPSGRPRALVPARHRRGHGLRLSQQQRPRRAAWSTPTPTTLCSRPPTAASPASPASTPAPPCRPERDSPMTCILRCDDGASQADYHELRYAWKIGDQAAIESFESKRDYYFRFGGVSHHAGEYQNYIEYFARCLEAAKRPSPTSARASSPSR